MTNAGRRQPPSHKLNNFWQSVFKTFSDILEAPKGPSATIAVFGITPQDTHLSHQAKNMIALASLLACQLILLKWREKFPPSFKMWIKDLIHHLVLEKIRYSTRGGAQRFYTVWRPFLAHVERMDGTDIGVLWY